MAKSNLIVVCELIYAYIPELCKLGTEEQNDWYFFSHKDNKYPTGSRTNRATVAGFWKATGRDKAVYSKHELVGMRKTLAFYKGRAPNGLKSDCITHEYCLETDENATEEGWVVCRVFKKRLPILMRRTREHEQMWYDDHRVSFVPKIDSPMQYNIRSDLDNSIFNTLMLLARKNSIIYKITRLPQVIIAFNFLF
ncbi:hypothetical protein R6Q57_027240 [Mikania cordata]